MKTKLITTVLIAFVGFVAMAQNSIALVSDQNSNYQTSLNKYVTINTVNKTNLLQGTTAQETYTAIDPMEEKRKRKELRKYFRSQRPLWRHQERLERAKNPVNYNNIYRGYNNNYRRNSYLNTNSLFNLGTFGYYFFN